MPTPSYSHVLVVTGARTWSDETQMRQAFRTLWQHWGPANVTKPLLISGHCPTGADAMAERLFAAEGFDVMTMPADWDSEPRKAGFIRNQAMIDQALALQADGAVVTIAAFLMLCASPKPHKHDHQLAPQMFGHYSHGTIHARSRAHAAGLSVLDVTSPSEPPF